MAKSAEIKVQTKIEEYLKGLMKQNHPLYFERRQAGGLSYKEGLPDLFGYYNGVHFEIEVKQLKGEARSRQLRWERKFRQDGVIYLRPDSVEEVIELFEKKIIPLLHQ